MTIRKREENITIWDEVSGILPNKIILEIEFWKGDFFRVMVDSDNGVSVYIIDLAYKVIALEGYWVQTAGLYLKLINNGEGLLEPILTSVNPPHYQWKTVIPCEYSQIVDYLDGTGLIRVIKEGKWGVIDALNNIIIPIEYNHLSPIYPLENGQFKVIARKNAGESEFNLFIRKNYTVTTGDGNVPRLIGPVILSLKSQE